MRVAIFIDHWSPGKGGAERALALLVQRLEQEGHDALVFSLTAAEGAPGEWHPIALPNLARGRLERSLAEACQQAANRAGCHVTVGIRHLHEVDVFWPHGGSHRATLLAGERSKGWLAGGVSRALHLASPRHRAFLGMERELLESGKARRVWCVSELVEREFLDAYPSSAARLELRPNGVDTERFNLGLRQTWRAASLQGFRLDASRPVLLFLGGNWGLKGWEVAVQAMSRIRRLPWTCLAAGARPEQARSLLKRFGLGERVRVVPPQVPEHLYGVADLLIQPTWRDPCSLSTLEALASGVPVITTIANGASESVRNRISGDVVSPGDPIALADCIDHWLSILPPEGQARDDAAQNARASVMNRTLNAWLGGLVESLHEVAVLKRRATEL